MKESDFEDENMIYVFVNADGKILIPFKGTEEEMLEMWEVLKDQNMEIDRAEYTLIWTMERNPFTPLL